MFFASFMMCNNKEDFTNKSSKINIYYFNSPNCGHCKRFNPEFNIFVKSLKGHNNITIIDAKAGVAEFDNLAQHYGIQGYPTVVFDYGDHFTIYNGERTSKALRNALKL
jgi:thiol-disulfide isomerase/thioredoxin